MSYTCCHDNYDKLFAVLKNVWHCFSLHTFIYLVVSIINKHKLPSAVSQCIIRKLSTNKSVKAIEIWHRINAQLANDARFQIRSRFQICKWHKFLKYRREESETTLYSG